jgi:DNA-binding CsgD family transcriptional regulator
LYGRRKERVLIKRLLALARGGHAGVLIVHGEAGIGKSTLLADAAAQADGFQLLGGVGVESEVELPFAGLHQILRPVLDRLDRLPAPQASALRGAFGHADTRPNRFLIQLGVLGLLGAVAEQQPVLCLIDDAHLLDQPSADALVFVARRVETEPIALLLAARDENLRQFHAPGLPDLRLSGLEPKAARQLLQAHVGRLAPEVCDRLIEETGGNPLALVELSSALTGGQLAGREPLPERLPLSARLQQAFLQRVRQLPAATQTLLLVAAAEDTGELATILAAGQALGHGPEALEPAQRVGLVQVSDSVLVFRHPLVRSAIYQGVTFSARQAAHHALIQALQREDQADRRAWHLAAATLGPDEQAAAALEASADRARRRGGPAAAAAALQRAAALTPHPGPRVRRLVAAAEALWESGHTKRTQALLHQIEPLPADATVRARLAHLGGAIELGAGIPAIACTLLIDGAALILASDPEQATEMLVLATWAALAAGELDRIGKEISPLVPAGQDAPVQRVADSLTAVERRPAASHVTRQGAPPSGHHGTVTTWPPATAIWLWPMLAVAEPAPDLLVAQRQGVTLVAHSRTFGTVNTLTSALANLATVDFVLGWWPDAISNATDGLRLASETNQEATACYFQVMLAWIAALQGRAEDCRRLADLAVTAAIPRRLAVVAASASWTLATLDLVTGRPAAALDRLRALSRPQHPTAHAAIALLATGDLVEAATHAGAREGLEPLLARLERLAAWDQRTWTVVTAHRCRALITPGPAAEGHFWAALAVDGLHGLPLELARTQLLYGQWLRRARRRADARPHLRVALETFERLGATPWAERARTELRASGLTARKRDLGTREQLTAQELQIARLAQQGLANREIAAKLFLSLHTVSYHLHKIYGKLGIASRADLRQLDLDGGGRY